MKKNLWLLIFAAVVLFASWVQASAERVIVIEEAGEINSLTQALASLPDDAGEVTIQIASQLKAEEDARVIVPSDKGITSLTIETPPGVEDVSLLQVVELYANGIPLTIGEGIVMPNGSIFGGAFADLYSSATVESTNLNIFGSAAYVYGGGKAFEGSRSVVRGLAEVEIGPNSRIYWEVFGGGLATGKDSFASVQATSVSIHGKADYALGGGSAQDGGATRVETQSQIRLYPEGSVLIALFGGGSAQGAGSLVQSAGAKLTVSGTAGWVFGGDFAYQAGETVMNGLASVELTKEGTARELYGGSFATDENSKASVNETTVQVFGTTQVSSPLGMEANGGETKVISQP